LIEAEAGREAAVHEPDPTTSTGGGATRPADRPAGVMTVDAGRVVIALGALALLVSLFLDWYGAGRFDAAITAWTSFEVIDLLLAALALAVLGAVAEAIVLPESEPRLPRVVLSIGGPLATILVVAAIINPPPLVVGADPELEVGIWIGLAGALVMTIGIAVSTLRISLVVGGRDRGRRRVDASAETRTMPTDPGAAEPGAGDPSVPPPR
jgi:hypothetical protein